MPAYVVLISYRQRLYMHKVIPIRVEPFPKPAIKFTEWQMHNVCNYECSFCGPRHRGGDKRWASLTELKAIADKLILASKGSPFWIQLTGGEPTLMPDIAELLQYIKDNGGYTSMISNGSRTLRWWTEIRDRKLLDMLYITYHPEQTSNVQHVVDVLQLFHAEPVDTLCLITHAKNNIKDAFDAFDYISEHTGTVVTVKAMMINQYDIYESYSEDEADRLKKLNWVKARMSNTKGKSKIPSYQKISSKMLVTYDDGSRKVENVQEIFKNQTNTYGGWQCDIGKHTLRIDVDTIYRGVCSVGGMTGKVTDPTVNFTTDNVVCDIPECFCGTDMSSTKYKT